jgi:hypothetical protein
MGSPGNNNSATRTNYTWAIGLSCQKLYVILANHFHTSADQSSRASARTVDDLNLHDPYMHEAPELMLLHAYKRPPLRSASAFSEQFSAI